MIKVISFTVLDGYSLQLRFSDGAEGIVDLSYIPRQGVFESWNDPSFFREVSIDPETGTLAWPGEIDLDPYVLYSRVTGKFIEQVLELI